MKNEPTIRTMMYSMGKPRLSPILKAWGWISKNETPMRFPAAKAKSTGVSAGT